jgi:DNA repair photolyase
VKRDVDLLHRFSDAMVGLSVPTIDDETRRLVEPAAPPVEGRLAALRFLADEGLKPFANFVPAYPLTSGTRPVDVARAFRDAGVAVVHAGAWQYLNTVLPALRERLPPDARSEFVNAVENPGYYERLFRALRAACKREGVRFEVIGPAPQRWAKREIRWVEGASGTARGLPRSRPQHGRRVTARTIGFGASRLASEAAPTGFKAEGAVPQIPSHAE